MQDNQALIRVSRPIYTQTDFDKKFISKKREKKTHKERFIFLAIHKGHLSFKTITFINEHCWLEFNFKKRLSIKKKQFRFGFSHAFLTHS